MKKIATSFFLLLAVLSSFGQKKGAFFEVGDKKIFFQMDEAVSVWRTVSDTIIRCKGQSLKNYPLGTNTSLAVIHPSEFKTLYREIFNENGCVWTRLTNDIVREDDKEIATYFILLNDSENVFIPSSSCFRYDTVTQINPVTMQEEQAYEIDSIVNVNFNFGFISKMTLCQAISDQLGLGKSEYNLRLKNLSLNIFNDKCESLSIDYSKPKDLELAMQKIRNVPVNSHIIIESLKFENTNGRRFYNDFYNLAIMKIKE